jgi:hypothetical protein
MAKKKTIYPVIKSYNSEYQLIEKVIFILQGREKDIKEIANIIVYLDCIKDKEKANSLYSVIYNYMWRLKKKGIISQTTSTKPFKYKLNY